MSTWKLCFLSLVVLSIGTTAKAQLIDFETDPLGGTPTDDGLISLPYNLTGGGTVQFYFDSNGNLAFDGGDLLPAFEAVGDDAVDGFLGNAGGGYDAPAPGFGPILGNFFMRPSSFSLPIPSLVIDYSTTQTITSLSGQIWDIDADQTGYERWFVEAFDAGNSPIGTILSPVGLVNGPLESEPWVFSFNILSGIDKVRITHVGTKSIPPGLAFDNFSPTFAVVPEAGSMAMMAIGSVLLGGAVLLRRRGVCQG